MVRAHLGGGRAEPAGTVRLVAAELGQPALGYPEIERLARLLCVPVDVDREPVLVRVAATVANCRGAPAGDGVGEYPCRVGVIS